MATQPIIDNSLNSPKSKHNLSCNWTGSADFGRLVPIQVTEMIPNEEISVRPKIEMQMLPLASPTFGKLDLYVHYFYVPTRLCWESATDFLDQTGAGKNDVPPFVRLGDFISTYGAYETLNRGLYKHWTSLGLPPFFVNDDYYNESDSPEALGKKISALPFRAYTRVWWDFYRDPEVLRDDVESTYIKTDSGRVLDSQQLLPRQRSLKDCWIANLFAQSGLENSIMGVDIAGSSFNPGLSASNSSSKFLMNYNNQVYNGANASTVPPTGTNSVVGQFGEPELRKMEALTRLAERMSLAGKRQIEAMFARYGVKPTYEKLKMAQYVGGGKATVLVSDITSSADTVVSPDTTSGYAKGSPLGAKAGAGYAALQNLRIKYNATEHGYLIGILSVMPHIHFVQGLGKEWFRNSFEDFFQKSLERTGQVAVPKIEVGMSHSGLQYDVAEDDQTFAFDQPYYERKRGRDILAGDMMYYHMDSHPQGGDENPQQLQYLQSMAMYVDYHSSRVFNADNLQVDRYDFNKIFYYLGGSMFTDSDDHFHLSIDKDVTLISPMDGYAIPTLETTAEPHKASANVGKDTVL